MEHAIGLDLPELADPKQLYMLIDGAVVKDAEQLCYQLAKDQQIENLYRITALDYVANQAPILLPVANNQRLLEHVCEYYPFDWGILLTTESPIALLADQLRSSIQAQIGQDNLVLFRFYLPHLIPHLLKCSTEQQLARIWGNTRQIYCLNRFNQQWQRYICSLEGATSEVNRDMSILLSEQQLSALSLAAKEHFYFRAIAHVEQYYPAKMSAIDYHAKYQWLDESYQQAMQLGFTSEQEILSLLNIKCMLDDEFMVSNHCKAVSECLHNRQLIPAVRVKQALQLATELVQKMES